MIYLTAIVSVIVGFVIGFRCGRITKTQIQIARDNAVQTQNEKSRL